MDLSSVRMKILQSIHSDNHNNIQNSVTNDYPRTSELNSTMANVSSQRFCLRWNNHQANLLSVFDQLLQDESFVDVTLAVEGQFLRAHKMVLSACSPYFQALFISHPDKHPIVILKDVPYKDMKCLLDFMYRGEVSVDQDRLTAFLKVADSLRIKGLTEVNEERCDLPKITNNLLNNQHLQVPPPQLHRINQQPAKRQYPGMNSAPLLGSALTAPKRKRGRPRKLSGSSDFGPGSPNSDTDASDVRTSESLLPELVEVKMEYGDKDRTRESSPDRNSNGEDKREEINAGTSQTGRGNGIDFDSYSIEQLLQPKMERRSSDDSNNSNLVIDLNNKPYLKREISPYSMATNSSVATSSDSPFTSFNLSGGSSGGTSAPPPPARRPIQTRRVRRRANSSSQDPAEQLTEMSVRDQCYENSSSMELFGETTIEIKTEIDEEEEAIDKKDILLSEDMDESCGSAGYHFLTDENYLTDKETQDSINEIIDNLPKARTDLLEYLVRYDKTVVCKLCGEVLPSRTHWYRHKYKVHVTKHGLPAGLTKCFKCNSFFKSRKGYVGHCVTRHGSVEEAEREDEENEELVVDQLEMNIKTEKLDLVFDEDVENVSENINQRKIQEKCRRKSVSHKYDEKHEDYMKERAREEKLVADIIAKVKKECEAQSITMCRRGYSRRSTVMTSFKEYDKRK